MSSPTVGPTPAPPAAGPATPAPAAPAVSRRVEGILSGMALEQKVGQIMFIGFNEPDLTPETRASITEMRVGGIIYFARNVQSPTQLAALSAAAQQLARDAGMPGLVVSIDQEGGRVTRLGEAQGFTEFPAAMAVGATGDPENARRMAAAMAAEMLAAGVNMDLAPDLDVNNNPANPIIGVRSFGSDPARVARFGVAFLQGLQTAGVAAVGKHFPGHGDTSVDSHVALPLVPYDRDRLDTVEFPPFRAAMAAGAAGIMSAHITFPAVDPTPGLPATLSPKVMSGLLRGEMRYDGLLMTDSLEMGALPTSGFPPPAAAAAALAAGADVLLMSHPDMEGFTGNPQRAAYDHVLEEVRAGRIPVARLDEAVRRVLLLKERFGLLDPPQPDISAAASKAGAEANRAVARAIADQAITLLRDDASLLPLSRAKPLLVVETPPAAGLGRLLGADAFSVRLQPNDAQIQDVAAQAQKRGGTVVVATADAARNPGQARLVKALLDARVPLVVAAVAGPYDLLEFPDVATYAVSYGSNPPLLSALAAVLSGSRPPKGRLPVELPGLYSLGAGITQ